MLKNGYEKEFSEKCFSQIEGFGKYGFLESHAASFALIVYASAWIKCHHLGIFASALLNSQPMGFYSTNQIIRDAQKHDVEVRPLCINNSLWDNTIEPDINNNLTLRIGFRQINGLSKGIVDRIVSKRENGFTSVYDVWYRVDLSYETLSKLIKSDCFSSLGLRRTDALWEAKTLRSREKMLLFSKYIRRYKHKSTTSSAPKNNNG
jgi:DNA polymerase III alpha subunit